MAPIYYISQAVLIYHWDLGLHLLLLLIELSVECVKPG